MRKLIWALWTIEPEADGDTNNSWNPWINPKEPEKEAQRTGDPREDGNRLNHSTVVISEIPEKSPGESRSLPDNIEMVKARQTLSASEPFDAPSVRSLHSSRSTVPWGKPSNLWTFWVYSLRPRVPSWTWIRCMEPILVYVPPKPATHRNTLMSPQTFAMSPATRNSAQTSNYIIPVLKQQTRNLLHLWRWIIPLRHLAAKIPSQLHNYFLPFFLPTRLAA